MADNSLAQNCSQWNYRQSLSQDNNQLNSKAIYTTNPVNSYEFKARLLQCFYNGAVQSLISEKFVNSLETQNAVGYDNSMHNFYWWRYRRLTELYFFLLKIRVFPLGWLSTRFSNLFKIRIERARLLHIWVQTEVWTVK